jgi:hypothetical protein
MIILHADFHQMAVQAQARYLSPTRHSVPRYFQNL